MGRDTILMLLLIALIGGYVFIQEARVDAAAKNAATAQGQIRRLAAELELAQKSERVVTRFVDRVQIVRERGATITKEVPIYVTVQADSQCSVPSGFVWLHDAAAANLPLGEPAGDPDAPAAGVALSTVAETVAGNYGIAHELRAQVIGLQEYVQTLTEACPRAEAR